MADVETALITKEHYVLFNSSFKRPWFVQVRMSNGMTGTVSRHKTSVAAEKRARKLNFEARHKSNTP